MEEKRVVDVHILVTIHTEKKEIQGTSQAYEIEFPHPNLFDKLGLQPMTVAGIGYHLLNYVGQLHPDKLTPRQIFEMVEGGNPGRN